MTSALTLRSLRLKNILACESKEIIYIVTVMSFTNGLKFSGSSGISQFLLTNASRYPRIALDVLLVALG